MRQHDIWHAIVFRPPSPWDRKGWWNVLLFTLCESAVSALPSQALSWSFTWPQRSSIVLCSLWLYGNLLFNKKTSVITLEWWIVLKHIIIKVDPFSLGMIWFVSAKQGLLRTLNKHPYFIMSIPSSLWFIFTVYVAVYAVLYNTEYKFEEYTLYWWGSMNH